MQSTRECSETACERPHYGRGWCSMHYQRNHLAGTLEAAPRTLVAQGATLEERLRHHGWTITPEGCWEWNGSRNDHNYGQLAVGSTRPGLAHRVSFQVFKGDPTGMVVRHTCDNPPCVNPAHLILGTKADNNADTSARQRNGAGELHHGARLTDAQVQEIRDRYAAGGIYQHDLAAEFGVCKQLVSGIIRGKRRTAPTRAGVSRRSSPE